MFQEKNKVLLGITKSNWGGAQKYVFDIATALSERYDVTVMLGGNGLLKDRLEQLGIETEELNIKRNISIFKDIVEFFRILKIVGKNNPAILHLNSSKVGIMGTFAGRMCNLFLWRKTKIIFTAHGWAFNENRSGFVKAIFKIIYWKTILMSHKTICVSSAVKEQVERWPFIKNKLEVIHNGVGELNFLDRNSARAFFDPQNKYANRIWIGTVGELHPIKRHEDVIEALRKISGDFVFFICGDGERRQFLQELINSFGMQDKVILYGFLENAIEYLKAFDIFTLTSQSEALGYAVLEAGKAELPVIASAVGGIPEIIENNESGMLVKVGDIEEISNAIGYLMKNPERSLLFANNLKNKVNNDFSLKEMIEKTINIYQNSPSAK